MPPSGAYKEPVEAMRRVWDSHARRIRMDHQDWSKNQIGNAVVWAIFLEGFGKLMKRGPLPKAINVSWETIEQEWIEAGYLPGPGGGD